MDKNKIVPEYLTIKQVGAYIGRSPDTLRRDKSRGVLPPHSDFSKPHRWWRPDIDAQMRMKRLGIWDEKAWLALRGRRELGVEGAWGVMLKRLAEAQAKMAAVVEREMAEQKK